MYELLLEDVTIVTAKGRKVADVAIEDGKIAYVGSRPAGKARERQSAIGKFVMPGIIDTHVHFRSPGHPHKETWETGSRAALSGGVTTVLDMPNTNPTTTTLSALREKRALAASESRVNFGLWAGATNDNAGDLPSLLEDGAVAIKVFMGASTGPLLVDDAGLERIFQTPSGLIGVHAEDEALLSDARERFKDQLEPVHNDVRPPSASLAAVQRLVSLVRQTQRPIHICHLTTSDELALLEPLRGELPITVEVCPHHLFLSVEANQKLGNLIKCNPPIRTELDRRSLWTALKRRRIDTIGSDHAPHTLKEKKLPYWEAPAGIPGVETSFSLMMAAVHHGRIGLERLVELFSEAPAKIFGLTGKGSVEVGYDADLVLFTEGELTKLDKANLLTKVGWSPFVGREVAPKPEQVILAGRTVARRGEIVDDSIRGREVQQRR